MPRRILRHSGTNEPLGLKRLLTTLLKSSLLLARFFSGHAGTFVQVSSYLSYTYITHEKTFTKPFFYKKRLFPIKSCTFPPLFFAVPQDNDYLCVRE